MFKNQKRLKEWTINKDNFVAFPDDSILTILELHFINSHVLIGVKAEFKDAQMHGPIVIGNVTASVREPKVVVINLMDKQRIVGVKFVKPENKYGHVYL